MNSLPIYQQIGFEIAKLILQLAGAALVAWLTVKLALSRFKTEKSWERRLSAYTDVLSALSEMDRALDRWVQELENRDTLSSDQHTELMNTYHQASRRVDEVHAIADLLLPKTTRDTLDRLRKELQSDQGSWANSTLHESAAVAKARKEIVLQGQNALGVNHR